MAFTFAGLVSELGKLDRSIPVFVRERTGSTNDDARALSLTCGGDFLVAADCQTGGKGTHGRKFFSPEKTGFYLSAALAGVGVEAPVTLAAAVAAVRTIREVCGIETSVKWVNDLLYQGRKAAGILCERSGSGTVIVGIGINLREPKGGFPEEIRNTACALGADPGLSDRMAAVFYSELDRLLRKEPETVPEEYRKVCSTIGKRIRFRRNGETVRARAEDTDESGALVILLPDGKREKLVSGSISVTLTEDEEGNEDEET